MNCARPVIFGLFASMLAPSAFAKGAEDLVRLGARRPNVTSEKQGVQVSRPAATTAIGSQRPAVDLPECTDGDAGSPLTLGATSTPCRPAAVRPAPRVVRMGGAGTER